MKAYSLDLRQKIVEAYKNQEGSVRDCAQRFKVSRVCSFVEKLLKQHQQRGNIAPLAHPGGVPQKLAEHIELVKKLVEEKTMPLC